MLNPVRVGDNIAMSLHSILAIPLRMMSPLTTTSLLLDPQTSVDPWFSFVSSDLHRPDFNTISFLSREHDHLCHGLRRVVITVTRQRPYESKTGYHTGMVSPY